MSHMLCTSSHNYSHEESSFEFDILSSLSLFVYTSADDDYLSVLHVLCLSLTLFLAIFPTCFLHVSFPPLNLPVVSPQILPSDDNNGSFKISWFDLSQYLRLDTGATRALNLFPAATDGERESRERTRGVCVVCNSLLCMCFCGCIARHCHDMSLLSKQLRCLSGGENERGDY